MRDYCRMLHTDASFDVADFDRLLVESALADSGPEFGPALLHTLEAGGKRIPALLGHEFRRPTPAPEATVTDLRLAIEFLHPAPLLHHHLLRPAEAARRYADHLGLAFQIVDDVLDYTGQPDVMGKPVGNDIREGTVTLPLILALEMSTAPLPQILASARERSDFGAVVMAVQRSGAIDRCLEIADEHSAQAVAALKAFPTRPDRDALEALAQALPSPRG